MRLLLVLLLLAGCSAVQIDELGPCSIEQVVLVDFVIYRVIDCDEVEDEPVP
jgi:hypothetical protein